MNHRPIVSVLMLTYNHSEFISESIQSILNQKINFSLEIVIGDDTSKDNSLEIINDFRSKYPKIIKTVTSENKVGPMNNYLRTLRSCSGKYIAFCDGDDVWIDDLKLQKQIDFLESNSDCNFCYSDFIFIDAKGEFIGEYKSSKYFLLKSDILGGECPKTSTVVMRASMIPEDFYKTAVKLKFGDHFTFAAVISDGYAKGFIDKFVAYRSHEGGMYSPISKHIKFDQIIRHYEVMLKYFDKKNDQKEIFKGIGKMLILLHNYFFFKKQISQFIKMNFRILFNDIKAQKMTLHIAYYSIVKKIFKRYKK